MSEPFKVKFQTTKGDFAIEVNPAWAPLGAARFKELIEQGFYDNAKFFRVLPGFVVQFGLPADPTSAPDVPNIQDDPVTESNLKGSITFATAGPGTRTSQVFINLADNKRLDSMGFSPFGKVVEGMEVVESLYAGYGEGAPHGNGPDQGRVRRLGNAYLDGSFPNLDAINRASIEVQSS
ncbi:MAG: peptidylprolyl isomerase [Bryobacteraceae bacterium]|jgi:peptidyl-prolyl cis-trans isomerase A (cyclophilin A)|nr:peptidylprolyl isomerase [Bryobacteraceae bacterium]